MVHGRVGILVLASASVAFLWIAGRAAWLDGPTYDEPTYVAAGLTALIRHDLRINRQHPPLAKVVAAIPLLASHPDLPTAGWRTADEHRLAAALVRSHLRAGDLRRTLFVARLAAIVETVAAAWILAALAERLVGVGTGWLPGVLWLSCPFIIGLGHLDGIDMPFALTALASSLAVTAARARPSDRRAAAAGVVAGLSVLTRVTGLLVVPAAAAAIAASGRPPAWRRAAIVVGSAWLTLAVVYLALAPGAVVSHAGVPAAVGGTLVNFLVPVDWRHGLAYLARAGSRPGPAFLFGRAHLGRWLLFWPGSVVLKLPPLTLAALAAGLVACRRLPPRQRRELAWCVALPGALLALFAVQQQRPLGLRYLLPALALAWVGTAALARPARPAARALGIAAVVGSALACVATPALAWTDPLAGPGYRVAADSNLDWGQGWWSLAAWAEGRRPWVRYFGGAGLEVPLIRGARDLRAAPRTVSGWVAVSASALTDYHRDELRWLRAYCPVKVLDRTILVYRFAHPVARAGGTSSAPPATCPGPASRAVTTSRDTSTASVTAPVGTPASRRG